MPFAVEDFRDLIELLDKRPDLRAQVRALVLSDEVLSLPSVVTRLAEAQERTEERLEALTERVEQLAEAQKRTEERLESLTQRVEQLAEAQKRTEERLEALTQRVDRLAERLDQLTQRVDQLTERLDQLTRRVDQLTERLDQLTQRVDQLTQRVEQLAEAQLRTEEALAGLSADFRGDYAERKYRAYAPAYFGPIVRRARVLSAEALDALLPDEDGAISERERSQLLVADVVVQGTERSTGSEAYLVVEVSVRVDVKDVRRARERAAILERATGKRAIPVVAGEHITEDAKRAAAADRMWCVLDGRAMQCEQSG